MFCMFRPSMSRFAYTTGTCGEINRMSNSRQKSFPPSNTIFHNYLSKSCRVRVRRGGGQLSMPKKSSCLSRTPQALSPTLYGLDSENIRGGQNLSKAVAQQPSGGVIPPPFPYFPSPHMISEKAFNSMSWWWVQSTRSRLHRQNIFHIGPNISSLAASSFYRTVCGRPRIILARCSSRRNPCSIVENNLDACVSLILPTSPPSNLLDAFSRLKKQNVEEFQMGGVVKLLSRSTSSRLFASCWSD